jgi:hypothetical protein
MISFDLGLGFNFQACCIGKRRVIRRTVKRKLEVESTIAGVFTFFKLWTT